MVNLFIKYVCVRWSEKSFKNWLIYYWCRIKVTQYEKPILKLWLMCKFSDGGYTVPSGRVFSWLPIIPTSIAPVAENVLVQPVPGMCGLPSILITMLPAGGFMGEGLMPVPEKICRKIVLWR